MATKNARIWKAGSHELDFGSRPLVMAILNVTPDSFSDGGRYTNIDAALRQAEKFAEEGADIIDIGGESTRPGGSRVDAETEIRRTVPVISAICRKLDIPVSIDTSKAEVAAAAIDAGAAIINDISGLRFDNEMPGVAAASNAGIILMHLRGSFETMHQVNEDVCVVTKVIKGLGWSISKAAEAGIDKDRICLDVGIGFSKTLEQNLELIARLAEVVDVFPEMPILVGLSRKSFIGKITGEEIAEDRSAGTIAANCTAVLSGANVLRVHEVKATKDAVRMLQAIKDSL